MLNKQKQFIYIYIYIYKNTKEKLFTHFNKFVWSSNILVSYPGDDRDTARNIW